MLWANLFPTLGVESVQLMHRQPAIRKHEVVLLTVGCLVGHREGMNSSCLPADVQQRTGWAHQLQVPTSFIKCISDDTSLLKWSSKAWSKPTPPQHQEGQQGYRKGHRTVR